ncbi:MAG: glutamate synthase large subunit, partial [Anaerolineae bacterium]|nr:glutamate synthase large subunit [Phycisphaerae bacterium]
ADLEKIRSITEIEDNHFKSCTLDTTFAADQGAAGLEPSLKQLQADAEAAVRDGFNIIILSDRKVSAQRIPIPALLACAAVHHHLIREGSRSNCGLVIETGEAREAHHFCLLIGYGAGAVNPYLAFETIADLHKQGVLPEELALKDAKKNYIKAANKAILKVASKMGISTIQSYRGAQIFEAIGLSDEIIELYFTKTASRIKGIGMDVIARECLMRHRRGFPPIAVDGDVLATGGNYQWRRDGEYHSWNPDTVAKMQHAVRVESYATFKDYTKLVNDEALHRCTIRGLLQLKKTGSAALRLSEVEPAKEIVKRFVTGAMSFGSISKEAHENLAIAMNRIGAKSNTGEGGEDPERFKPDENGDSRRSAIKQVASARFGVTTEYLVNANELQIKMAQGAKPGEGGALSGAKVDEYIAKVRHSTPGVGLISPPPHHDIYSIEDLSQLIHDLKNVNPDARISVKLVSEVGVGTIAAGVVKAKADHVLISGDGGGTGNAPLTSVKHAGIPWELGLAETQQVLVMNDLRGRVTLQCDGQIKTGRDVAIAMLLGAEECGFSTGPLIASGCIMMRVCHLNTCPVGIATQDPELRKKFAGKPEHVINFFFFIAEELREIMAEMGFRTVDEMVGRVDLLEFADVSEHWKAKHLDLSVILHQPEMRPGASLRKIADQDHGLDRAIDNTLIELAEGALENGESVSWQLPIKNINRSVGTMLSGHIAKRFGDEGLPTDTITFKFSGSAGQSFGAFLARGVTLLLEGDANDHVGKGLSGGTIAIYPPKSSKFNAEENVIAGNVIGYGASAGELYIRGAVGERFCVRNSGASAVVEGVGDHGCEYMTGGRVVVIGPTGRNFAAGMSGGIAYVYDEAKEFEKLCNLSMVELETIDAIDDAFTIKRLLETHLKLTGSTRAKAILDDWENSSRRFVKVMPTDYRRVLQEQAKQSQARQAKPRSPVILSVLANDLAPHAMQDPSRVRSG